MASSPQQPSTFEALARAGFEVARSIGAFDEGDREYKGRVLGLGMGADKPEQKPRFVVKPAQARQKLTAHIVENDEDPTLAVSHRRFTDSKNVTRSNPFRASFFLATTLGSEGFHQSGERAFTFHGGEWSLDIPLSRLEEVEIAEIRGGKTVSQWIGAEALGEAAEEAS